MSDIVERAQDAMVALWDVQFTFCPDCGHRIADHFHSAACVVGECDCTAPSSAAIREAFKAQLLTVSREREAARDFIEWRGYRRCDTPACNCGSWHGGHAQARLDEIREALEQGGVDLNGRTLRDAVLSLLRGEQ